MTLADAIAEELPFLRAEAEARMLDTFEISLMSAPAYDATSKTTGPTRTLLFATKGRVKAGAISPHDAEVGGRTSTTVTRELHIPVSSPAVPAGAVAVCTAVGALSDQSLLGASLVLAGPAPGSQTTARRLQVTEVLS